MYIERERERERERQRQRQRDRLRERERLRKKKTVHGRCTEGVRGCSLKERVISWGALHDSHAGAAGVDVGAGEISLGAQVSQLILQNKRNP